VHRRSASYHDQRTVDIERPQDTTFSSSIFISSHLKYIMDTIFYVLSFIWTFSVASFLFSGRNYQYRELGLFFLLFAQSDTAWTGWRHIFEHFSGCFYKERIPLGVHTQQCRNWRGRNNCLLVFFWLNRYHQGPISFVCDLYLLYLPPSIYEFMTINYTTATEGLMPGLGRGWDGTHDYMELMEFGRSDKSDFGICLRIT
jgi:hypothetical protein